MKTRLIIPFFLSLMLISFIIQPVKADGIIIPTPFCEGSICPAMPVPPRPSRLSVKYHHVKVRIENQIAVTHVDQVFLNPNRFPVEGTYLFPLPLDAVVSGFTLWVDGKAVEGKVLDAAQARHTYEDIVRSLRDPALLEYAGRGAVQARIFPIPAGGERRIELEYSQALTSEGGLVQYQYPLNTEKFSSEPIQSVSVDVEVTSSAPIRAVYSPSHPVDIQRSGETRFTAGYEATNVKPDTDFVLYYSMGETEAFHLLSYRDPRDPLDRDGFFLALLAPRPGEPRTTIAKDVLVILDRSGSMEGEKFKQAQTALNFIMNHLGSEDRFYISTFSSSIQNYAPSLRPAAESASAIEWAAGLHANGSTDINRALLEAAAVADSERPTYIIFITDGLPTVGVTDTGEIIKNFTGVAQNNLRLFPFGVGYDVDTFLLDTLSLEHHGQSTYVKPGASLDEVLSAFYARISTPLLTGTTLDFKGAQVFDMYPEPLPDLFSGSQVVVVGRYRSGGQVDVTLSGLVNDEKMTFPFQGRSLEVDSRSAGDTAASIPRLWATRKIGNLLNEIRLQGNNKETVDQIVRLSIRYGIVTPYTSYLVTEPMPLGVEEQSRLSQDTFNQMAAAPTMAPSGAQAVQKAADQAALSQAEVAPTMPGMTGQSIQTVGPRTFILKEGVWMDTVFDPKTMTTRKIAFLSPDYFSFVQSNPAVAASLALGERVIVVLEGTAYEIIAEGGSEQPLSTPSAQDAAVTPGAVSGGATPTAGTSDANPTGKTPTVKTGETLPGLCFASPLGLALLGLGALGLKLLAG